MIEVNESFVYWNYFLALEEDIYVVSRFIEFKKDNFKTYSYELAKLLISTASQVDVILREITSQYSRKEKANLNINDYITVIEQNFKELLFWKIDINKFDYTL